MNDKTELSKQFLRELEIPWWPNRCSECYSDGYAGLLSTIRHDKISDRRRRGRTTISAGSCTKCSLAFLCNQFQAFNSLPFNSTNYGTGTVHRLLQRRSSLVLFLQMGLGHVQFPKLLIAVSHWDYCSHEPVHVHNCFMSGILAVQCPMRLLRLVSLWEFIPADIYKCWEYVGREG
jgi:hypothetical protein